MHPHSCSPEKNRPSMLSYKNAEDPSQKRLVTLSLNLFRLELGHMPTPLNISGLFYPQKFSFLYHFGHSSIHSFDKHLLSSHYVLGNIMAQGHRDFDIFSQQVYVFNFYSSSSAEEY